MFKKILLLIIISLSASYSMEFYLDGTTGLHSKYVWRGMEKSSEKPVITQSFIADMPEYGIYLDSWLVTTFDDTYYEWVNSLNYSKIIMGKHILGISYANYYSPEDSSNTIHHEIQTYISLDSTFPLTGQLYYDVTLQSMYITIDSYVEIDYHIPWYFSGKIGYNALTYKSVSSGISDLEFALSTYIGIGNYSIEPIAIIHIPFDNSTNASPSASISLSFGYHIK